VQGSRSSSRHIRTPAAIVSIDAIRQAPSQSPGAAEPCTSKPMANARAARTSVTISHRVAMCRDTAPMERRPKIEHVLRHYRLRELHAHAQVEVVDDLQPPHAAPDPVRNLHPCISSPPSPRVGHGLLLLRFEQDVFALIDHIDPTTLMNTPWCRKLRSVRSSEKSVKL
jgi:hypothetical protein